MVNGHNNINNSTKYVITSKEDYDRKKEEYFNFFHNIYNMLLYFWRIIYIARFTTVRWSENSIKVRVFFDVKLDQNINIVVIR